VVVCDGDTVMVEYCRGEECGRACHAELRNEEGC
jgi:hypothetical protein